MNSSSTAGLWVTRWWGSFPTAADIMRTESANFPTGCLCWSVIEFVAILKSAVSCNGHLLWVGDYSFNPVDSTMRISRNTQVSWLGAPFCQPFPTLIHCQRLYTAQDAPSGLSFIWPGLVNSSRICTHGPGWMRDGPEGRSAPTRPLEGAWPRRTEAVTSHGQTWLWRLSKGASIGCSIKTFRI